jgi:uncharacterized phage protein (TIGR01671 family)
MYKRCSSGLKDSNGKDILEGDVYVTDYLGNEDYKYVVTYHMGAFCGGLNENNRMPLAWKIDEMRGDEIVPDDWMSHITVIGNIYDNPELMDDE